MIRFGGKIELRLHDDQHYSYIGGDTKILTVDRSIKFSNLIEKLSSMTFSDLCLKYQQPGGELDSLISVYNDDDLESMMFEYDRMCRVSPKPASCRMKIFLFPLPVNNASSDSLDSAFNLALVEDSKSDGEIFVNMLNSVHRPPPVEDLPPPSTATMKTSPDYLFGFDNNQAKFPVTEPDFAAKDAERGTETETVTEKEIQEIQIVETVNDDEKKVKVNGENDGINGNAEQQVKFDGGNNGGVEVSSEENAEKVIPLVTSEPSAEDPVQEVQPGSFCSCSVQVPEPVSVQSSFTSEIYNVAVAGGGYSMGYSSEPVPVYLIPTPSGLYQAMRPITGPTGQPVYFAYSPIVNNGGGYSHGSYVANRSALPL